MGNINKLQVTRVHTCNGMCITLAGKDQALQSGKFIQFSPVADDNIRVNLASEFQRALAEKLQTIPGMMRVAFSAGVVTVRFNSNPAEIHTKRKEIYSKLEESFEFTS